MCILIVLGIVLVWNGRRVIDDLGVPKGKIVYSDSHAQGDRTSPFFSKKLEIVGKPDYVLLDGGMYFPVELKSSYRPSSGAYFSHKMQVAAYCHLIEEKYGVRPNYGIIKYLNGIYKVHYSKGLERCLVDTVQDMRNNMLAVQLRRSHNNSKRCMSCSIMQKCGDSLTG